MDHTEVTLKVKVKAGWSGGRWLSGQKIINIFIKLQMECTRIRKINKWVRGFTIKVAGLTKAKNISPGMRIKIQGSLHLFMMTMVGLPVRLEIGIVRPATSKAAGSQVSPSLMYSLYQRTKEQGRQGSWWKPSLVSSSKQSSCDLLCYQEWHIPHMHSGQTFWMSPPLSGLQALGESWVGRASCSVRRCFAFLGRQWLTPGTAGS